jgi:hypothetical protein
MEPLAFLTPGSYRLAFLTQMQEITIPVFENYCDKGGVIVIPLLLAFIADRHPIAVNVVAT